MTDEGKEPKEVEAKESREIRTIDDLHDLSTLPEVAELFRITLPVCRKWNKEGKFPNAKRLGKQILVPRKDIIAVIQQEFGEF